jgi:hypothetical protein
MTGVYYADDHRQSFADFTVDQTVLFELFEDPISDPRALQVHRRHPRLKARILTAPAFLSSSAIPV